MKVHVHVHTNKDKETCDMRKIHSCDNDDDNTRPNMVTEHFKY